jgi:hypothetical protein
MLLENGNQADKDSEKIGEGSSGNSPKPGVPIADRAGYTPREFAALFGRHYTWGYRRIYAGQVKVIIDMGRMIVPREEVDRIRRKGIIYSGKMSSHH